MYRSVHTHSVGIFPYAIVNGRIIVEIRADPPRGWRESAFPSACEPDRARDGERKDVVIYNAELPLSKDARGGGGGGQTEL